MSIWIDFCRFLLVVIGSQNRKYAYHIRASCIPYFRFFEPSDHWIWAWFYSPRQKIQWTCENFKKAKIWPWWSKFSVFRFEKCKTCSTFFMAYSQKVHGKQLRQISRIYRCIKDICNLLIRPALSAENGRFQPLCHNPAIKRLIFSVDQWTKSTGLKNGSICT